MSAKQKKILDVEVEVSYWLSKLLREHYTIRNKHESRHWAFISALKMVWRWFLKISWPTSSSKFQVFPQFENFQVKTLQNIFFREKFNHQFGIVNTIRLINWALLGTIVCWNHHHRSSFYSQSHEHTLHRNMHTKRTDLVLRLQIGHVY